MLEKNSKNIKNQEEGNSKIPNISMRIPLRLVIYFSKNKNYTYLKTFVCLKALCESNGYIEINNDDISKILDISTQTLKRHLTKLLKLNFIGKAKRHKSGYFVRSWNRCDRELSKIFDLTAQDIGFSDKSINELTKGTKKIANRQRYYIFNAQDFFINDAKSVLLYAKLDTQMNKQEYMHYKNNPALKKKKSELRKKHNAYEAIEHQIASYEKEGQDIPQNLLQMHKDLKPFHTKHEKDLGFPCIMGEKSISKLFNVSRATANRYRNRMEHDGLINVIHNNEYIHGNAEELAFKQRMYKYAGVKAFMASKSTLVLPKANTINKTYKVNIKYKSVK